MKPRAWLRPMVPREHGEPHRQASWLELLFDLSFVVAVAQAAVGFEHAIAAGHYAQGVIGFLVVFAAIWWAWMAFTWFANVFDTDDVPYRLLMFVMIGGSLGLAAGVPRIAELDFRVAVASYVVMRLAYVAQWWRVLGSRSYTWRPVARRMIALTTFNQLGWVAFLWVPTEFKLPVFVLWFGVDVATPFLAGWDARLGGHRHHIVERYGLFTILVIGESIAAATVAIGHAMDAGTGAAPLLLLAFGGLLAVLSIWWIYFDFSTGRAPTRDRRAQLVWGYGHYFIFASVAALGAGLALAVVWIADHAHVAASDTAVALVACSAVATFLVTVAFIESVAEGGHDTRHTLLKLGGAAGALGAGLAAPHISVPGSILTVGLLLVAMVAYGVALQHRLHRALATAPPADLERHSAVAAGPDT